jgi:hypothetical protein
MNLGDSRGGRDCVLLSGEVYFVGASTFGCCLVVKHLGDIKREWADRKRGEVVWCELPCLGGGSVRRERGVAIAAVVGWTTSGSEGARFVDRRWRTGGTEPVCRRK